MIYRIFNIQYFTPVNKFPSKNFKKDTENLSFWTEQFQQNTQCLRYVLYALLSPITSYDSMAYHHRANNQTHLPSVLRVRPNQILPHGIF